MPKKIRVDQLMVERGLAESRSQAQRLVMAGKVRADDQIVPKASTKVVPATVLTVDQGSLFVSRGGEKLAAAFEAFDLQAGGAVCADVGASTGGFTDCLLRKGAAKVYAIDVGKGILHWGLRNDTRVVVMEGTNARFVERLPEAVQFVTIDVSFISLKILLPVVLGWFATLPGGGTQGQVVALIKPQFEAGRRVVARGKGVIRDPKIHQEVLVEVLSFAVATGYTIKGLARSPVLGPKGNVEFLAWLHPGRPGIEEVEVMDFVSRVVDMAAYPGKHTS